ncbi:MAG: hypothetical protein AMK73_05330, partial [Planctomycetes bacterium SM23_32]
MDIIDTHAHLDAAPFAGDLTAVLARAGAVGVERAVCVGTDLPSSERCVALAGRFPGRVYAAVGIHPNQWADAGPGDFPALERLARHPAVVAVGETGLDFHRDATARERQVGAFRRHLRLARAAGLPVIVHARKADEEVLAALAEEGAGLPGVRHCFEGPAHLARRYVELGLHLSVGAAITRPGYKKLKAAMTDIRADRLLVETDCPYQAPASRGGQRNEPAFIVETVRALAELRGETPEQTAALTTANAE